MFPNFCSRTNGGNRVAAGLALEFRTENCLCCVVLFIYLEPEDPRAKLYKIVSVVHTVVCSRR